MDEKATQLHAIASLKVLLDATKPQDGANGTAGGAAGGPVAEGDAHDSGRASQGTEVGDRPTVGPVAWVGHRTQIALFHVEIISYSLDKRGMV